MALHLQYELDLERDSVWNIISPTAAAKQSLVYMQENGDFLARKGYYTTREGLDSFLIKLTLAGCGLLEYGGQRAQIQAGRFYWIDCSAPHHYRTDPDAGHWHVIWVHFNGATARAYYETFLKFTDGGNVAALPVNSPVYGILRSLLALYGDSENHFEMDIQASGLLTQLMVSCIGAVACDEQSASVPAVVLEIRNHLTAHYAQRITLEDLSAKFLLNTFYLQKLFKRHIGQSPTEYLIYLRMTQAKSLLRTTQQSVSEIAYAVGIDNNSHFTRLFKKHEGMTPLDYRRLWPAL